MREPARIVDDAETTRALRRVSMAHGRRPPPNKRQPHRRFVSAATEERGCRPNQSPRARVPPTALPGLRPNCRPGWARMSASAARRAAGHTRAADAAPPWPRRLLRHVAPPPETPAAPPQSDRNLAEMAQQLEAALRRAPPEGRPPVTDPLAVAPTAKVAAAPARARVQAAHGAEIRTEFESKIDPKLDPNSIQSSNHARPAR